MKNPFRLPEGLSEQGRNAYRIALLGFFASVIAVAFYVYLALQSSSLLFLVFTADNVVLMLGVLTAFIMIRRGQVTRGVWTLLVTVQFVFLSAIGLVTGVGLLLGGSSVMLVGIIAGQTLPGRTAARATLIASGLTVAAILVDLFLPAYRAVPPAQFFIFLPIILVAVVLIFGFVTARQFRDYSLLVKLVIAFIIFAIVSVGSLSFIVDRSLRTSRTTEIADNMNVLANAEAIQIGQVMENDLNLLNGLALTQAVQDRAALGTQEDMLTKDEINQLDLQWRAADAANNNGDPLVAKVLYDSLSAELINFQKKFPEHVEVFLTDLPGVSLATTDRTSDYLQSDEDWWQIAYKEGQYIGQPEFDASSKTLAINMAVPVRARGRDQIVGVLRTTVNINSLSNVLSAGLFGQTGRTDVYLPDGQVIKLKPTGDGKYELTVEKAAVDKNVFNPSSNHYQQLSLDGSPSLVRTAGVFYAGDSNQNNIISKLGWLVVVHQTQTEAFQPVETQTRNDLFLAIVVTIVAAIAAIVLAQVLAGPLIRLNAAAQKVASGDLSVQAKVESGDETGILAATFNIMVSQLKDSIGSLEQRVSDRTKALATVAEVGTTTSTILETDKLLQAVVDLTKERFSLYHSHIYLLDEAGENLVLASGAGEPGRQMKAKGFSIPLNREQSLVARAARERKGVTVNDVTQTPDFLPNPLLPDTHSELAVPMIVGGNVIGVFDVQSEEVGRFTDADISVQTTLAAQVATSVQNVRSFEKTRIQAELETMVNAIGQKIQHTTSVDDALQTAIREIGSALGAGRVSASIGAARKAGSDGNSVN